VDLVIIGRGDRDSKCERQCYRGEGWYDHNHRDGSAESGTATVTVKSTQVATIGEGSEILSASFAWETCTEVGPGAGGLPPGFPYQQTYAGVTWPLSLYFGRRHRDNTRPSPPAIGDYELRPVDCRQHFLSYNEPQRRWVWCGDL
jgi:hypothetical protein